MACESFLKNKWVSKYLTFNDFMVPQHYSLQKISITCEQQKV